MPRILLSRYSRYTHSLTLKHCALVNVGSVPNDVYMWRCERLILMVTHAEKMHGQSFTALATCMER